MLKKKYFIYERKYYLLNITQIIHNNVMLYWNALCNLNHNNMTSSFQSSQYNLFNSMTTFTFKPRHNKTSRVQRYSRLNILCIKKRVSSCSFINVSTSKFLRFIIMSCKLRIIVALYIRTFRQAYRPLKPVLLTIFS